MRSIFAATSTTYSGKKFGEASERFFALPHCDTTKVGGYPTEIQHAVDHSPDYVFQIASEQKPQWTWADNGVATFSRDPSGLWHFACQSY